MELFVRGLLVRVLSGPRIKDDGAAVEVPGAPLRCLELLPVGVLFSGLVVPAVASAEHVGTGHEGEDARDPVHPGRRPRAAPELGRPVQRGGTPPPCEGGCRTTRQGPGHHSALGLRGWHVAWHPSGPRGRPQPLPQPGPGRSPEGRGAWEGFGSGTRDELFSVGRGLQSWQAGADVASEVLVPSPLKPYRNPPPRAMPPMPLKSSFLRVSTALGLVSSPKAPAPASSGCCSSCWGFGTLPVDDKRRMHTAT